MHLNLCNIMHVATIVHVILNSYIALTLDAL